MGRHPILEKISYEQPVPNNSVSGWSHDSCVTVVVDHVTFAAACLVVILQYAAADNNFIIVTGPNMVGMFL